MSSMKWILLEGKHTGGGTIFQKNKNNPPQTPKKEKKKESNHPQPAFPEFSLPQQSFPFKRKRIPKFPDWWEKSTDGLGSGQ